MNEFKIGDIVWLKVGSPKMIIDFINSDSKCSCTWFDGNTKYTELFRSELLTKENPTNIPPESKIHQG